MLPILETLYKRFFEKTWTLYRFFFILNNSTQQFWIQVAYVFISRTWNYFVPYLFAKNLQLLDVNWIPLVSTNQQFTRIVNAVNVWRLSRSRKSLNFLILKPFFRELDCMLGFIVMFKTEIVTMSQRVCRFEEVVFYKIVSLLRSYILSLVKLNSPGPFEEKYLLR